ncbi:MAG TPA: SMC-Scp complex subunit ScpB, partial [Pseudonocardiaceae bacterium]
MSYAGNDAERSDEERRLTDVNHDVGADLDLDVGLPDIAEAAPLDPEELGSVLEALLLVVDTPVSVEALAATTQQPVYRIATKLQQMADELTERDSGIDLRKTSEG